MLASVAIVGIRLTLPLSGTHSLGAETVWGKERKNVWDRLAVTVFGRHLDKGNCQDCTQ